ncbi:helix-turn-helix domain-containing protein [Ensifer sp. ENS01]|nr:AraC family transcriptional regulator [Ensifer sp. ENS01]MBD9497911.1 helix-turn-helix domain-containing protein [Ensifer sp. ENS01]
MRVYSGIPEAPCGSFEAHSRSDVLRGLEAHEPNVRWKVFGDAGNSPFTFNRQNLPSGSITAVDQSGALEAHSRRGGAEIGLLFVLAGEIEVAVRRGRKALCISAGQVASLRDFAGRRLSVQAGSSWLAFSVSEATLRQHFESATGRPYVQEFDLTPTGFDEGDGSGLYQTLRGALDDLSSASLGEKPNLAKAYEQLALVKLFTKLPHNLADAFGCGSRPYAPPPLLQAEVFMRRNLAEPVTIEDLAEAAGCSSRTLQRLFRSYRGTSPMGVLCNYRLACAHSTLQAGQVTSIAELAARLQFSNPGRFSVLYKTAYGFKPSSSRRLARDDGRASRSETEKAPNGARLATDE